MTTVRDITYSDTIAQAEELLKSIDAAATFPDRLRRVSLSEAWFSDHLAWLLDTRGSHGLGSRFAEEFLKTIARRRTQGDGYKHRAKFLRWGKRKMAGTLSTAFDLHNAAVFREFFLARRLERRTGSTMLCDVMFLDLDTQDGIIVAIENKLFTTNHHGQLERYFEIVEDRYHRAKVREYVYLTMLGGSPRRFGGRTSPTCERMWVRLSWKEDILAILNQLMDRGNGQEAAREIQQVLQWIEAACAPSRWEQASRIVQALIEGLAATAAECLVDELIRLNGEATGSWKVVRQSKARTRIIHSSKPTVPLYVGVLPNLSIVLYSDSKGRSRYDKLLIPFGSNADQIFNIMDLVARDIYPMHFGENYRRYLSNAHRLTAQQREVRAQTRSYFEFVHAHRHEWQLLVPLVRGLACHVIKDDDFKEGS